MRYGVHLANWGPWASPNGIATLATRAEQLGFDAVWVSDHIVSPLNARSKYPYPPQSGITPNQAATHYEPLVTLAYVAGHTSRIRLGTTVLVVPMRNPVYTAKLVATLDALSGGRVVLGVGVGWLEEEFEALGAAPFSERGAVMEEYLRLYRRLWSDEITEFHGAHYQLEPVRAYPKPHRQAGPPIWFGGHSLPARRRAVELGDGWHPVRLGRESFKVAVQQFQRLAEERGRGLDDLAIALRCDVGVGLSEAGALDWQLFGSADRVAELVGRYQEAGCTDFMAELHPRETTAEMLEALERFAEVVSPRHNREAG